MSKRFMLVLLVLLTSFALLLTGCSSDPVTPTPEPSTDDPATPAENDTVYKFRIATQESEEHNDTQAVMRAAEKISELTDGKVEITVYPANQLGDYLQVFDEVLAGTIDMAAISISTTYDPRLEMLTIPYLTTNYQEAIDTFLMGSEFFDQYSEILSGLGVKALTLFTDGYMGVGSAKSITAPMDFTNSHSGLLIRCPSMDSYLWTAQGMNYATTTIAYADLYSALQTGVCDGWVGGSAYVNYLNFRDVLKYFCDARYIMELIGVVMNEDTFNSLPADYQKIISDVFYDESVAVAESREDLDNQAMTDMEGMGMEIYVPTDAELSAMRDHFKAEVWPKYEAVLGDELFNMLLK